MEVDLSDNDTEFNETNSNLLTDIQNDNHIINNNNNQNDINVYNINDFQKDIFKNKLMVNNILINKVLCQICNKTMKLEKAVSYHDGFIWRCRSNFPKHDIKINIRRESIFENINIPIPVLHFITFYCFLENYSIDKTLIECNNNKNLFENYTISKPSIIKIYNILRNKIKIEMHKNWKNKLLGESITEKGFAAIEIDESEIIGNSEIIYWMFGLIDRVTKEARIFCVLNDRTKNNLLPLVKNNVLSNDMNEFEDDENMEIDEEYQINTRIYSDCYSSYQVNDFLNMGYILKRVNHSVWFCYGSFHSNNIEGLW